MAGKYVAEIEQATRSASLAAQAATHALMSAGAAMAESHKARLDTATLNGVMYANEQQHSKPMTHNAIFKGNRMAHYIVAAVGFGVMAYASSGTAPLLLGHDELLAFGLGLLILANMLKPGEQK